MRKLFLFISLISSVILIRCAQPRNLSGGEKDTIPPKVLKLSPQNLSTGFQGQTLAMEFDEYVQIKNLNGELVVSPPLSYPVTYRQKGKRVFFDIQDTLKTNTTYNFNFGNAIVDLNESNPLDSNLFVFSTGNTLDSGIIYGTVKDAYSQKLVDNAVVVLYPQTYDSALYKGEPLYVTKTNNKGEYELQFLRDTEYQIFALATPGEKFKYIEQTKVGFANNLQNTKAETPVDFAIFEEKDTTQYVSKSLSKEYFSFNIGFNNNLINPKFKFSPSPKETTYIIEEIRPDTFKFWINGDLDIDSVTVNIVDETNYSDTVQIDIKDRTKFYKKLKKKKETRSPVRVSLGTDNGVHHYFDTLRINFSRPISTWQTDSMWFVQNEDTMVMKEAIVNEILTVLKPEINRGTFKELRSVAVTHKWKPMTNYAFIFNQGAFKDIIHQVNDTTILKFKTKNFEDYGSFRFKVEVPGYNGSLVLELLNQKDKFIRNYIIKPGEEIFHELAVPGTYKFRLIIDRNGNKKWDTGNISKGIQPEEVVYYSGTIEIRANWDMEETWKVDLK
ncbi:MAG: Ig-like domain-containing protein [Salibacteraceae bacterium]